MPPSPPLSAAFRSLAFSNQDTAINRSADAVEQRLPGHEELPFDQIAAFPGQDLRSIDFSQIIAEFAEPDHGRVVPAASVTYRTSSPGFIPSTPLTEYKERHAIDNEVLEILSSSERLAKVHSGEIDRPVSFSSFYSPDVEIQRRNVKRLLGIYCDNRDRNDPRFHTVIQEIQGHDPFVDLQNVLCEIDNLGPFLIERGQVSDAIEYIIVGNWQRVNAVTAFILSTLPCERNLLDVKHMNTRSTGTNPSTLLFQGQSTFPDGNRQLTKAPFPNTPPTFSNNTIALPPSPLLIRQFVDERYRQSEPTTSRPRSRIIPASSSTQLQPQLVPSPGLFGSASSTGFTLPQQPRSINAQSMPAEVVPAAHQTPNAGANAHAPVVESNQASITDMGETPREGGPPTQQSGPSLEQNKSPHEPAPQYEMKPEQKPEELQKQSKTKLVPKQEPSASAMLSSTSTSLSSPSTALISSPSTSISSLSTSSVYDPLPKKFERPIGKDFKQNGETVMFNWHFSHGQSKINCPGRTRSPPAIGDLFFHKVPDPKLTGEYLGSQVWLYTADTVWVEITAIYFSLTADALPHPAYGQYFLSMRDDQSPTYVKTETWKKNQKSQRKLQEPDNR